MRKYIFFLLLGGLFVPAAQAQGLSIINSAGNSRTIANHAYAFSIGEMTLVQTFTSSSIIVTQGLLQPASEASSIEDHEFFRQHLRVYPNPARDAIYLQPDFHSAGTLSAGLYDISGRAIGTFRFQNARDEKQVIRCSNLAAGSYLLKVTFTGNEKALYQTTYQIQILP